MWSALTAFGAPLRDLRVTLADFTRAGTVVLPFLGLAELVANKRATGRTKDIAALRRSTRAAEDVEAVSRKSHVIDLWRDTWILLHPVDLAVNKVLAVAGRDEPRDFVDILFVHGRVLPLAALCWAAVGKDPGFTPLSLLELLKRRGRYRPEDFARLNLTAPFDLHAAKQTWLEALAQADSFARARPPDEIGCLYYAVQKDAFVIRISDARVEGLGSS